MSSSGRFFPDADHLELPVFLAPSDLSFSSTKRRGILTIYNPYNNDANFRIMTTSPERFDVSNIKGIIKPNRRIDVTIRLIIDKADDLPEFTEEPKTIDFFRVSIQIGYLKGSKSIKVLWTSETPEINENVSSITASEDKSFRQRIRSSKTHTAGSSIAQTSNPTTLSQRNQKSSAPRAARQLNQAEARVRGSNVSLVCFIGAIACVIILFLPLSIDSELCKRAKSHQDKGIQTQDPGLVAQIITLLSISYEMKLGCSFALGLFTYRLISTPLD